MAFNPFNLALVSQVGTRSDIRRRRYSTTDSFATVTADGYFDTGGGNPVFNIGDIVEIMIVDNITNALRTEATFYEVFIATV
jgi:hypothetical protein